MLSKHDNTDERTQKIRTISLNLQSQCLLSEYLALRKIRIRCMQNQDLRVNLIPVFSQEQYYNYCIESNSVMLGNNNFSVWIIYIVRHLAQYVSVRDVMFCEGYSVSLQLTLKIIYEYVVKCIPSIQCNVIENLKYIFSDPRQGRSSNL